MSRISFKSSMRKTEGYPENIQLSLKLTIKKYSRENLEYSSDFFTFLPPV